MTFLLLEVYQQSGPIVAIKPNINHQNTRMGFSSSPDFCRDSMIMELKNCRLAKQSWTSYDFGNNSNTTEPKCFGSDIHEDD
jgi:hypothetical protein